MVILIIPANFFLLTEAALIVRLTVKTARDACVLKNLLRNVCLTVSIMVLTKGRLGWRLLLFGSLVCICHF